VSPIVIFTRLQARPGGRDELIAAFDALHDAVSSEPGTTVFAMHVAADDPDLVLFYEVYADDDALATHRESDAVREIVPHLAPLLARAPEITYASPVRAKGIPLL
jgi:(4S)-4-hydroxy-5-phosphonooxypentane-2,3-dione isomerase